MIETVNRFKICYTTDDSPFVGTEYVDTPTIVEANNIAIEHCKKTGWKIDEIKQILVDEPLEENKK